VRGLPFVVQPCGRAMVWGIIALLLLLWLAALIANVGSATVHILAVVAILLLIYQVLKRRGHPF